MNAQPQITLVDNPTDLRTLRKRLASEKIIAIDTEFHAENRYFPKLMLLQIASIDGDVWLVDPLKVNPEPIGVAMRNLTIISHSGREDVKLLYRALGLIPEKYFDTQIAAGILGYHYPMGLDKLAKSIINEDVSKGESLTDWSQRPLNPSQIQYAAQDARILIPLYQQLLELLHESNKAELAWAASEELLSNSLKPRYSGTDWINWNVAASLDISAQRVLTRLLEWREDLAEKKNKPAKYLLPRSSALYLAKHQPRSLKNIQNRRINRHFLKKYGKEVIQIIQQGLKDTDVFSIPTPQEKLLASILLAWTLVYAEEIKIHHSLLLPSSIANKLAQNGLNALLGWRSRVFGDRLQQFLQGEEQLAIANGVPVIQS